MFGSGVILWMVFVVKVSRYASEIFNDELGYASDFFIVVAILWVSCAATLDLDRDSGALAPPTLPADCADPLDFLW